MNTNTSTSTGLIKTSKKPWTFEEDERLMELVELHGVNGNWPQIALEMKMRSGKQCRERYINQLDPRINKSVWTLEEDATIKRIHFEIGNKWCRYMDQLPGRSDNAIKNRYHVISRNNFSEHNHRAAAAVAIVTTAPKVEEVEIETSNFVPETAAVRLDRFRAARALLDRKIEALEQERELLALQVQQEEAAVEAAESLDFFEQLPKRSNLHGKNIMRIVSGDDESEQTGTNEQSLQSETVGQLDKNKFPSTDFDTQDFSTILDEFYSASTNYGYSHGSVNEGEKDIFR